MESSAFEVPKIHILQPPLSHCRRSLRGYWISSGHYIKHNFNQHYNYSAAHFCLSWVCQQLYLWWVRLTNNSWKKEKKANTSFFLGNQPVQSSELHKSLMQLIPESEGEHLYLGNTWRPEHGGGGGGGGGAEPNPNHKNTAKTSSSSNKIGGMLLTSDERNCCSNQAWSCSPVIQTL